MKYDEFAFVNQQLAGMLKSGIPLEGSLRQLCATMQDGSLRMELQQLEADLSKGIPLREALRARRLPEFYAPMLQIGVQSNDLPGVLTMLADYYERLNALWIRLKGLMVYPLLVLGLALVLSTSLCFIFGSLTKYMQGDFLRSPEWPPVLTVNLVLPPILLALVLLSMLGVLAIPRLRRSLRWQLPGFKEASLSQCAAALGLMLKNGGNLNDALSCMQQLEKGTRAGDELSHWQQRLASGCGKFNDLAAGGKIFPPLFTWLVANSGEDLAGGFRHAAEIYYHRAVYKIDLMLYAALPVSILVLGVMIIGQLVPLMQIFTSLLNDLGSMGD